MLFNYQSGEMVQVVVTKADGRLHRRWMAQVERVSDDLLVFLARAGTEITSATGLHRQKYDIRSHYWPARRYNLSEFYDAFDGKLVLVYSDIISPVQFRKDQLSFVDHELDVAFWTGHSAEIVDEDEFAEAVVHYDYSVELQQQCWDAAEEALQLVIGWRPAGIVATISQS